MYVPIDLHPQKRCDVSRQAFVAYTAGGYSFSEVTAEFVGAFRTNQEALDSFKKEPMSRPKITNADCLIDG